MSFQLLHTNNFPCELADCHRRFKSQADLDIHMRKHRGEEKPYVCSECNKSYASKQDLKVHLRNHTGKSGIREAEKGIH